MVRLSNQRSTYALSTFFCRCLLSVSIDHLTSRMRRSYRRRYIYLLGMQYLVSLSDSLTDTFPLHNTLAVQKPPAGSTEPVCAPGLLGPITLLETEPSRAGLRPARDAECRLARASCDPLLFLTTNLSSIFGEVLGALQTFARAAGCLALPSPVTLSSLASRKPHSHHASSPRSMNRGKLHLRWVPPTHLRNSRPAWRAVTEVAPRHTTGTWPAKFGVLMGARRCGDFPSRNPWLRLVRGTRGASKCRSRSYHTRYCPT